MASVIVVFGNSSEGSNPVALGHQSRSVFQMVKLPVTSREQINTVVSHNRIGIVLTGIIQPKYT